MDEALLSDLVESEVLGQVTHDGGALYLQVTHDGGALAGGL